MAFRSSYGLATTVLRKRPVHIQVQIRCFSKFDLYGNSPLPADKQQFVPTSETCPKGFLVGGISVGIKPTSKTQPDLVLASEKPSSGAAVFTKSEFPAASITVSRDLVRKTKGHGVRGVIANSWRANLFPGKAELEDVAAIRTQASTCPARQAQKESLR
jgi:glutamate N-acetyltransferase/amino-acid N-acetyltransferase